LKLKFLKLQQAQVFHYLKTFKKKWCEIHINKYNIGIEDEACGAILENVKEDILNFVKNKLKIKHSRGDYSEFLELVLIFLGGDLENNIIIYPLVLCIKLGGWQGQFIA